MMNPDPLGIAAQLRATASGEDPAVLIGVLHEELRGMAGALFRGERADHTLQPTALVSEACVRLLAGATIEPMDRARFFALASKVMRQVLIDHARTAGRDKRGGRRHRVTLGDPAGSGPAEVDLLDLLALDEALEELAALDERKARLVELRFFGGLSLDDSAKLLGIARSTASDDWRMARAWLLRRLRPADEPGKRVP
jgi:RNA polymerase sigma factor (TIGR02999 family)